MTVSRRGLLLATAAGAGSALAPSPWGWRGTRGAEPDLPGKIAFARNGTLWVWNTAEGARRVYDGPNATSPRWSPDGTGLLYVQVENSYSDLYLLDLASLEATALTDNRPDAPLGSLEYADQGVWVLDPAWAPSGIIAFASDDFTPGSTLALWVMNWPGAAPELAPSVTDGDNIEGVTLSNDGGVAGYTIRVPGENGRNITQVALRDLNDGTSALLATDPNGAFDPAIGPDDRRVAVCVRDAADVTDIWLLDRAGGPRTRVTTNAQAVHPCWSPYGDWLAYIRMVDFTFEIWASPISETGAGEPVSIGRFGDLDVPGGLSWTR